MWELDHKEDWPWKNWPIQMVMLGKTLKSPLDGKGIKQANPKVNQPWMFIGRADAEDEAPILWPPMWRANPLEKSLMLEKIEYRRKRGKQGVRCLDASSTQRTWVWAGSGRWRTRGKPGILQSTGSRRAGRGWVREQQQMGKWDVWVNPTHRGLILKKRLKVSFNQ